MTSMLGDKVRMRIVPSSGLIPELRTSRLALLDCVPAKAYEAMLERIEDLELNVIADAREGQTVHRVALDDL